MKIEKSRGELAEEVERLKQERTTLRAKLEELRSSRDSFGTKASGVSDAGEEKEQASSREQAEVELKEERAKLEAILESVGSVMSMIDRDLNVVWANGVAEASFGPDVVGQKCYRVFHGRDGECKNCLTRKVFEDGKIHTHQTTVKDNKGDRRYFHCTSNVALRDEEGDPRTVLEISRDVTAEKEESKELRLFRRLMDEIQESILIIDPETGAILNVNETACRQLGYSRVELLQKYVWELSGEFSGREAYLSHLESVSQDSTFCTETTHKRADGSTYPVEVVATHVQVGEQEYRVALARDITQRQQTEQELRRKSQEMEQFAYAASHDLRQPLNQLFAFCDFLERDLEAKAVERVYDDLSHIRSTVSEMGELITDLLKLSRAGSRALVREQVNTKSLLREVLDLYRKEISEKGAEIRKLTLPVIRADRALLKQVFQNLIGNALKYAGSEPVIKVGGESGREEVMFWVEDDGPGIPPAELEKIFLPMYCVNSGSTESTGLGLATCQKIVERHGGRIRAINRPEGGARFEFNLPVVTGLREA